MMLLDVQDIATYYGSSQALFGVEFSVAEGEVVALMGRNGMGKSTTIKSICNLLAPKTGRILFDGKDTGKLAPYKVARLGVGLVPEGRRCFPNLTVHENLVAAA
ncbi:MAG: ATP-binding cassette domain-containing protein, partial [Oxalobacteraceae bacterium]